METIELKDLSAADREVLTGLIPNATFADAGKITKNMRLEVSSKSAHASAMYLKIGQFKDDNSEAFSKTVSMFITGGSTYSSSHNSLTYYTASIQVRNIMQKKINMLGGIIVGIDTSFNIWARISMYPHRFIATIIDSNGFTLSENITQAEEPDGVTWATS